MLSRPTLANHVCCVHKSIYGLKQAPRAWFMKFRSHLLDLGFISSHADTSLFIHHAHGHSTYLLLYVDDIILTGSSTSFLRHIINQLRLHFARKDLGPLHYFLSIEVGRNREGMFLLQTRYTMDLLNRANMLATKPVSSLASSQNKLRSDMGDPLSDPTTFHGIVEAIQYLTLTRPNIIRC